MPTRLNTNVLIPLCTDLTQLEGAADLTVKLILLLLGVTVVVVSQRDRTENDKRISQDMICILSWHSFSLLLAVHCKIDKEV